MGISGATENPQSIKRLGHFLTADNISAGTPNGGQDISGATDNISPEHKEVRSFFDGGLQIRRDA